MDDLIYILLGLAWVIYAAYRANQKQKQKSMTSSATGPPASPREQPRPLDTIFGEILGEGSSLEEVSFPESQSYDDITVKELEEEKRQFSRPKTILETIPSEEGISAFDSLYKTAGRTSLTADEEEHISQTALAGEGFDLRKAVIYAEILNRPYR